MPTAVIVEINMEYKPKLTYQEFYRLAVIEPIMDRTKEDIEKTIRARCIDVMVALKEKNYHVGVTQYFKSKDKTTEAYFEPRYDVPFVLSEECKEVRIDTISAGGTRMYTEFYKVIKDYGRN